MPIGRHSGFAGRAILAATIILAVLGAGAGLRAAAISSQATINYTRDQAVSGQTIYTEKCATCHGDDLEGRAGPTLKGADFRKKWMGDDHKAQDLFTNLQRTMPLNAPGSLMGEEYTTLVVYLLSQNGYQPTSEPFAAPDLSKALALPASTAPVSFGDPPTPATPFPQAAVVSGSASTARPDDDELARADDSQWPMYNRAYSGQRFSHLDQITAANAAKLVPLCIFQPGEIGAFQASPVIFDGMLYITTPFNTFAVDPVTCRKIWEYRYPADKSATWLVNRGVAIYRGKLFRGTPNGHLIALDAKTGKLLWDVWMADKKHGYFLSGAPIAHQGLVYMGTGGADWGANGYISAFDSDTGKLRWSFNVIPTGKEVGAETWGKGADKGGGSFWSTFALDRANGQLLAPVGNPAPDFRDDLRPGDNLFTNSVVALDARTGKLKWWVQQVPHDTHDWDTGAAPIVYDQDDRRYMAVANKGGWLYLYDRSSRKLLAQPEISPHENSDVPLTKEGVHHCPGTQGGAEWNGAAYSPATRALYINSVHWCATTGISDDQYTEGAFYLDGNPIFDPVSEAKGFLHAFDAATGKLLWDRRFDAPMVAGITPTAGGVLFTGSFDGDFLALDARDGKTLYSFNTGGAVAGGPSTYTVNGKQYVAIASGNTSRLIWHSEGAMMVVVFTLRDQ